MAGSVSKGSYIFFCDTSETGYGAVGYLRFQFKGESACCSFIMEKLRLASIKL